MNEYKKYEGYEIVNEKKRAGILGKTFLFFGVELILTALFTYLFSYLFSYIFPLENDNNFTYYYVALVISMVATIVLSIYINHKTLRKSKVSLIATLLYILCMSLLLSSLTMFIEKEIMVSAVLITSSLFIIMAIFALLIKGNGGWLIGLAVGLAISLLCLYLVNTFLLIPLLISNNPNLTEAYFTVYYISEGIVLVYACVITIIDVLRIKRQSYDESNEYALALYHSLNLYNDFILILLKVISILLRSKNRD